MNIKFWYIKKENFGQGQGGGKCPLSTSPDSAPVCSYSNSSTDMGCLESDDPNSQLASSGRLNHSLPQKEECQGPCMSPTSGTTSTNASTSSTATHTEEYAGRLQQCNVFGNTTRSHFPLLRLKRNQPCFEGGGHKTLHHHVLQPKHSVMYWPRVGRWTWTKVQDQDEDSNSSTHHLVHNKDSEDLREGPQWLSQSKHIIHEDSFLEL